MYGRLGEYHEEGEMLMPEGGLFREQRAMRRWTGRKAVLRTVVGEPRVACCKSRREMWRCA